MTSSKTQVCMTIHLEIGVTAQVKYKEVMKQYNLGPNGGILTSLNLFATRFDQVGHDTWPCCS